jgi:hypothetical protein
MAPVNPWTDADTSKLYRLIRVQGLPFAEAAAVLNRSVNACRARLAVYEGRRFHPTSANRGKNLGTGSPEWGEAPPKVKTNHLKHCLAVVRANNGCGFPVCDAPPTYRVAA